MNERFCANCYNFEDRRDIDGVVLCAKGYNPETCCKDFVDREKKLRGAKVMENRLNGRFCWNCDNFEDRRHIDGALLCAKGHHPKGNCEDFVDRNKKSRDTTNNNRFHGTRELFIQATNDVQEIIKASNLLK